MPAPPPATLRGFLLRAQAVSLYRDFLRAARLAPDASGRRELARHVAAQFRIVDPGASDEDRTHALREGSDQLKRLRAALGLAGRGGGEGGGEGGGGDVASPPDRDRA